jgi:ribosomal protein S18 acetylase RimI-like enzyme
MTGDLVIREYEPDDQRRVWELHETALRETGAYFEGAPESDLEDIEGAYLDRGGTFLVGVASGEVVTMGAFRPATGYITEFVDDLPDDTAEVKRMRVAPGHQRKGYGQEIFGELERRARERGVTELVLDTTPHLEAAQQFYEDNAFEMVANETVEYEDGEFELLFYRKSLQ